jgi:hypothetical protein
MAATVHRALNQQTVGSSPLRMYPKKVVNQTKSTFDAIQEYLVPIDEALPSFDKAFPSKVLIVCSGISIFVKDVCDIFVNIWNKIAKLWPQQLIEELLDARLKNDE